MSKYSTFRERVEFGLDTIPGDRTVAMPLRDFLFIHQTLGELVRFFHQPRHYPDLPALERFLGFGGDNSAAFKVLAEAYYQKSGEAIPPDIDEASDEGVFDHPLPPEYYDDPESQQSRNT